MSHGQPPHIQRIVPCECGSTNAYWHGPVDGEREYACDECWEKRAAPQATGGLETPTKKKYVIEETCRYEIEAESMEEAKRIWLNDLRILSDDTQPLFIDVTDRTIECITPNERGEMEADHGEEF